MLFVCVVLALMGFWLRVTLVATTGVLSWATFVARATGGAC